MNYMIYISLDFRVDTFEVNHFVKHDSDMVIWDFKHVKII